jgi:hypothetical protein
VRTSSGARAVQIVHSTRKGSREITHIGSAHTDAELEVLKAAAWPIEIQAGTHTVTAEDPLPDEIREIITKIHTAGRH